MKCSVNGPIPSDNPRRISRLYIHPPRPPSASTRCSLTDSPMQTNHSLKFQIRNFPIPGSGGEMRHNLSFLLYQNL